MILVDNISVKCSVKYFQINYLLYLCQLAYTYLVFRNLKSNVFCDYRANDIIFSFCKIVWSKDFWIPLLYFFELS